MPGERPLPALEHGDQVLNLIAVVNRLYGFYDLALDTHRRGLEVATKLANRWQVYSHQIMISRMLWRLGRLEEALEASEAAESNFRAFGISDWPTVASLKADQAFASEDGSRNFRAWFSASWFASRAEVMIDLGRHAEALDLFLKAEETRAKVTPDDFTQHLYGAGAARALQRLGRAQEALDEEHDRELASFLKTPSLPFVLYRDGMALPYSPSGVMGESEKVVFSTFSTESPYEGDNCFEWHVDPGDSWVAVAWLEPANDWGEQPGGYDLSGAKQISFFARGSAGGEQVVIGAGVIEEGDYPDTLRQRMGIELGTEWQRFTLSLQGMDLSTVRCAFVIESELTDQSQTVYFDDIRIE